MNLNAMARTRPPLPGHTPSRARVSEGENHRLTMNKMAPLAQIPQNSNPAVEIEAIDGNGDRPGDEPVGSANPYEAMLSKMVAKLPYNVRETVGSIVQSFACIF